MPLLAGSAFLKALGWALLSSLWQFAILFLIYKLLTASFKTLTATARHSLGWYLLICGTMWFFIGLSWKYSSYPVISYDEAALAISNTQLAPSFHSLTATLDNYLPYWSILYLVCIAFLFVKLCIYITRTERLQRRGITKLPVEWRLHIDGVARQLGIKRSVSASLSSLIDTPQVIGVFKPIILIPLACLNNLSTAQMETVILHELVHIRRNDYLINLFVATAEILFFFNPFVRQLVKSIKREREYSCDDMVIQFQYHPHQYASALLTLEKARQPQTLAMAANGVNNRQLLQRIQRIVGMQTAKQKLTHITGYICALLLLGFVAMVNPAKMAVDELTPGIISFAGGYGERDYAAREVSARRISSPMLALAVSSETTPEEPIRKLRISAHASEPVAAISIVTDEDEPAEAEQVADLQLVDKIEYSMPDREIKLSSPPALTPFAPYVPSSSFSYQMLTDTSYPVKRRETYSEKQARESLERARLALAQIDWKKIEKDLKYDKVKLEALKSQLAAQFQELDWKKINDQVQSSQHAASMERLNNLYTEKQHLEEARKYMQADQMMQAMENEVRVNGQLLKATEDAHNETLKKADDTKKKTTGTRQKRVVYL